MNDAFGARAVSFGLTAIGLTFLAVVAPSRAQTGGPPGSTWRCAIHLNETTCIICDDCKVKPNGGLHCDDEDIIGGISCVGNFQASCTLTDDGWDATCVTQP